MILAVVVLYRCQPPQSATISSLRRSLQESSARVHVLVYDNSPSAWDGNWDSNWTYHHDPANGGIRAAYECALQFAAPDFSWLLLLDQDSELPPEFLRQLFLAAYNCTENHQVAAIVPRVYASNRLVSPLRVRIGRRKQTFQTGLLPFEVTCLNSGATLRLKFLRELGGFNPEFWLDFLDYWVFHEIHRRGFQVFVMEAALQHRLSVLDYNHDVSFERYRNILSAEMRFTNHYRPFLERLLLVPRLGARVVKQALKVRDKRIALHSSRAMVEQFTSLFRND
jgi:glycosyltransferase involved in cell wall biosynthesis